MAVANVATAVLGGGGGVKAPPHPIPVRVPRRHQYKQATRQQPPAQQQQPLRSRLSGKGLDALTAGAAVSSPSSK